MTIFQTSNMSGKFDVLLSSVLEYFRITEYIGRGAYGIVLRAVEIETDELAVLKLGSQTSSKSNWATLNKEIELLIRLNHKNIIRLIEGWQIKESERENHPGHKAIMVLENCICDLHKVLQTSENFTTQEIKTMATQLFQGLDYLGSFKLAHCDIKPANILISADGYLKICDFGFTKRYGVSKKSPGYTLSYAPPEVLLGTKKVDYAIDSWSAGCVIAQLYKRRRLFDCFQNDRKLQLKVIFMLCGPLTDEALAELSPFLRYRYEKPEITYPEGLLNSRLREFVDDLLARNLLRQLLVTDPRGRLTSKQALESQYFQVPPLATMDLLYFVRKVTRQLTRQT